MKLPLSSLLTIVLDILFEVILVAIFEIVEELIPPTVFTIGAAAVPPKSPANCTIPFAAVVASVAEFVILALTKAAVAISVPIDASEGVGAMGVPVNLGDSIVLPIKVSVPAKVARVPVVGNVTFVSPKLVNVVLKLPAVVNALAVVIFPPKVIVLPVLTTPVPPYCPAIADVKLSVPSNGLPYIVFVAANFVDVLALPAKLAVIIFALKSPVSSLFTKVFGVFVEVAEAIVLAMFVIVDELTPPILFDELVILETTKAAVATSVPIAASVGVVAVGVPVNEGDDIVLFVKVSAPVKVARVPPVGNVILVGAVLISVVLKPPEVVKSAVVEILPPKLIVFVPLFTPVPP